jgi:hypothetical protein
MRAPFVVNHAGVQYVIKDQIYPDNKLVMNSSSIQITFGNTSSTLNTDGLKISDGTNVATINPSGLSVKSVDSGNEITLISGPLQPSKLIDTVNSSAGLANQVLSSTGTGTQWINYSAATPNLSMVLSADNDAGYQQINNVASLSFAPPGIANTTATINTNDGITLLSGPLKPTAILDTFASTPGDAYQLLSSTGSGTQWVTPTTPTLSAVIGADNDAGYQYINNVASLSFAPPGIANTTATINTNDGITLLSGPLKPTAILDTFASTPGDAYQLLSSTGSGTQWVTPTTPTLSAVIGAGNSAGNLSINNISSLYFARSAGATTTAVISTVDGATLLSGPLKPTTIIDTVNTSTGLANQVLSSTGSGTQWITPTIPTLSAVIGAGNSAGNQNINNISSLTMSVSKIGNLQLRITSDATSTNGATYDVPSLSQGFDENNRIFQNKYMEVVIGGTHYYLPLYI